MNCGVTGRGGTQALGREFVMEPWLFWQGNVIKAMAFPSRKCMFPDKGDFVHDFRRFTGYCPKFQTPVIPSEELGCVVDTESHNLGEF